MGNEIFQTEGGESENLKPKPVKREREGGEEGVRDGGEREKKRKKKGKGMEREREPSCLEYVE